MSLGMVVGLYERHIVLDGDPAPLPEKGAEPPPILGAFLLRPNGWMHQVATWNEGRTQPRRLCVRWDPVPFPPNAAEHPIFGPRLLWPNGCMDQDAAWYGGRRRPTRHCVRSGPSSPSPKGAHPQFSSIVHCGQTAGWTKMPLGMEVGLGTGDFVFDGDPATSRTKGTPTHPIFGPCLLWPNGWMDEDATWCGSRPRHRPHCITRGPSCPQKGHCSPPFFAHVYCGHGRPSQLLLSSCYIMRTINAGLILMLNSLSSCLIDI